MDANGTQYDPQYDPKYKYYNHTEIPYMDRYIYTINHSSREILKVLQSKYLLKYIFNDNTWTIINKDMTATDNIAYTDFNSMFDAFSSKLYKVQIYEEPDSFKDNFIEPFIKTDIVIKTHNPDITSYRLDCITIIHKLVNTGLIHGWYNGFCGIHDSKMISYAYGYARNNELAKNPVSLDSVLEGHQQEYTDLRDHLMKLYIDGKKNMCSTLPMFYITTREMNRHSGIPERKYF